MTISLDEMLNRLPSDVREAVDARAAQLRAELELLENFPVYVKGQTWLPAHRPNAQFPEPIRIFSHFFEWKGDVWISYEVQDIDSPRRSRTACTFKQWQEWIAAANAVTNYQ